MHMPFQVIWRGSPKAYRSLRYHVESQFRGAGLLWHSRPVHSSSSDSRPPFSVSPSFRLTQSPNPKWELGQGLTSEAVAGGKWRMDELLGWKTFDIDKMGTVDVYRLLTTAITPRPIAFVSTLSASGAPNLAPFSYFSLVSHNPPLLSIAFTLSRRRPKDTRENIKATKEFVVNIVSEPFAEAVNSTSVEAPHDVDEWMLSGLTQAKSVLVKPPRVKESAVSLECKLYHFHDITPPDSDEVTNSLVLGHIKLAHIRHAVLTDEGVVDPVKLRAISRLGGTMYARVGEGFEIPRPSWRAIKPIVDEMSGFKKP